MYHLDTLEKFQTALEECDHQYVKKLSSEIEEAVRGILVGGDINTFHPVDPPRLLIALDDPQLYDNADLFTQIVCKHLAVERYNCYQQVQKLL